MKDEVEEFLRRVAQLRAQAEAQAKGVPPEPAPPPKRPTRTSERKAPWPAMPRTAQSAPAPPPAPQVVNAELADTPDRVARQVTQDLSESSAIAEHARHLGEEVDAAHSKMDARLHQVFDHQLGQLKQSTPKPAEAPADATTSEVSVSEMIRMLRSPQSVRDAIILSELLKRPEHLW